jgi:small GTP-binding protein
LKKFSEAMTGTTGGVKTVFLGEAGAGKTSIITAYCQGHCPEKLAPTVGASFLLFPLLWDGIEVEFAVWDTAGQEIYHSLAPMYYRTAKCAVVVIDLSNRDALSGASDWITELRTVVPDIIIVLCGNKCDLEDDRQISYAQGLETATSAGATYVETSAKTGMGLETLFKEIAQRVGDKHANLMRNAQVNPTNEAAPTGQNDCC